VAAASGDNVVDASRNIPWYSGPTLLEFLESVVVADPAEQAALRFPVQYVIRPLTREYHDYRGYAGTIAAGKVVSGQEVIVLPIGARTTVASVDRYQRLGGSGESGDAVTIRLADDIDLGRGGMIVDAQHPATMASRFTADLCWMSEGQPLKPGQQFWLKHTTRRVRCVVQSLDDRLEVESYERTPDPASFPLNEIGRVTIRTMEPIFVDNYEISRDTGSFILIDTATRRTVAAGMVREVATG
jgi:sulfate adenylyltransferase subunit 1 (EFTu-like GTPase family)